MNIFNPLISGSLSVSGSGEISGDLTVLGTLFATISGTSQNAISASHAGNYTLTSSFGEFTSSYNTGSFTGSFIGNGEGLYNIPASGVTGLNLNQISDGSATASISQVDGFRVNTNSEFTGSVNITGSIYLNGEPIGTGKVDETTFNSYTSSNDLRVTSLENTTSSLNSFTSSIDTTIKNKLDSEGVVSGSIQIDITGTTGFSTFSSSVSQSIDQTIKDLNTYTSSTDNRLNSLESTSASLNTFSSSVLGAIEVTGSNLTIKGDLLVKGTTTQIDSTTLNIGDNIISLNGTATNNAGLVVQDASGASIVSGSLLWDTSTDYWKAGKLGSEEKIILSGEYSTFSSSVDSRITSVESSTTNLNSYTSSNNNRLNTIESTTSSLNTYTGSNNVRLGVIETTTGSLNSFTSSTNTKLNSLETASGSIRTDFNSYTSSNNTNINSIYVATSSLNSYTSSTNTRLNSIETSTGSLNTYTGSNNVRLGVIESTTGSLNTFTSSANGRLNSLETASGSIRTDFNSYTSSNDSTNTTQNNRLTSLESSTSSLNTYTSSTNTRLGVIETTTGSINSYTSSTNVRLNSIETSTSSLNTFTSSTNGRLNSVESTTSSLNTFTSSTNTRLGVIESTTGSLNTFTSSANGRLNSLESTTSSLNSFTNSINTTIKNKLNTDGVISGSIQVDITQTTNYTTFSSSISSSIGLLSSSIATTDLGQNNRLNSIEGKTGSYATTGSNNFIGSQIITGSLTITQNLTVLGSSSLLIVTSSQLALSSSTISVNVFEPAERFGGIKVYDSGSESHLATASLLWDSLKNHWIYQNASGSNYSGGMLLSGPRNTGSLGDEIGLTSGRIAKSVGGDHLDNSIMSETNGSIGISGSLVVTGSISASGTVYGTNITAIESTTSSLNSYTASNNTTNTTQNNRLTSLESTTSSLNSYTSSTNTRLGVIESSTSSLNTYTSSNNTRLGVIESTTSSLNTFTSSASVRLNTIESTTGSLNTFTSSTNTRLNNIETSTGSLNSFTSSANGRLNSLESTTSSLNSYTSSNNSTNTTQNNRLTSLESTTSSLNSYTSSNTTNINAIHTATSSLNTFTSSADGRLNSIESKTGSISSLNTYTGSNNTVIGTLQTSTGSLNSYTSSNTTNINAIHTATSSLNSFTSSANGRLNSIESKTGSIASLNTYTGSNNTVIGTLQTSTSSLNSYTSSNTTNINAIHTATSSLNTFTNSFNSAFSLSGADVTVKGNFIVSGTTTTVNSTTVSIGDNIIQLNGSGATNAGIVVRDATSPTTTSGSFLWDTTNDKWIAGPLGSEDDVVLRTATQTLTNKTINASQLVDGSVSNAKLANSSFNIGTTSISLGRASASQTLTGVSIDGNAGTVTNGVYTTGDQTIGGLKTFSSNITNSATADWYMYGFGSRGASSGQYGMGLGSDIANRTLSFHIPNHAAYSSSGVVPKFGWYSNGSVELMTLQSATGNLVVTGTISASNFSGTSSGTNTGDQTNITGNAGTVTNGLYTTSDQTITGQKTFPSAIGNRPILSGGFISAATGDLNVDIWGISEDYYPSHATAANAWGIRWNGDGNDLQFVGGGTNRVVIDLDAGNITSTGTISGTTIYGTWNGTAIANAYLANSSFNIGTTSITLGRASASQTLTGVSIDGNAATVTNGVYTTGTQTIGGAKTFTSPMVIDTTEAWDATNPMLNVGGTGDGRIQVRHIHGKSDSSASADNLWLQYQNPSKHVQIGASGGGNNLYVSGDIYMNGYLAGNKVATESYVTSQGYLTSVTNISGYAGNLYSSDTRTPSPSSHGAYRLNFGFTSFNCNNTSPWADYLHLRSYSDSSGGADNLVVFRKTGGIEMRIYQQSFGSGTAYSDYRRVAMTKATTFSNVSSVTFTHDLLTENLTAQVFDTNGDMFWPTNIRITSTQVILTFSTNRSGRLVVTG